MKTDSQIRLTLSPGVSLNWKPSLFINSLVPGERRGDKRKFVQAAIVKFHQAHFKHMRLTIGEMIADLQRKLDMVQHDVITCAVVYHVGKTEVLCSQYDDFRSYMYAVSETRNWFPHGETIEGGWIFRK